MPDSSTSNDTGRNSEREVSPQLPTSGQILGVLVKALGIEHKKLQTKTSGPARRYFSGRLEDRVKESSRSEIIKAIAEILVEQGMGTSTSGGGDNTSTLSALTTILDSLAVKWDRFRAFLSPRTPRVYPSHLSDVWRSYARLVAIDLALRVAAQMHLSGANPTVLDFLDWIQVDQRGRYLDNMRSEAGIPSRSKFSEYVHVDINTVDGWVVRGARPHGRNLRSIAKALTKDGDTDGRARILRELKRLYWASDLAGILGGHIGTEAVAEIIQRLMSYSAIMYDSLRNDIDDESRPTALADLLALGSGSGFSGPLLKALASNEMDDEWNIDILATGSDWMRRMVAVNYQVHRAEVEDLIQRTDGGILRNWDVSNPAAYAHYERSMELQIQGRMPEALAEVAKAAELDPLDPANHFTLGSVKGGMGAKRGDAALVEEGLEECWLAAKLDPNWLLPWTEIGWILFMAGREVEAVEHLMNIGTERDSPDGNYYTAMGLSLRQMGRFAEALTALETALKLDPDNPVVVVATAVTALLAEDKAKADTYTKMAIHMGFSEEVIGFSELVKAAKAGLPPMDMKTDKDRQIQALDAALRRNPSNASDYLFRARVYFEKGDDDRSISDLGAAIWFDPGNATAYWLRGIVYGHLQEFDRVILDMSEVIRLRPGDADAYYQRGMAYGEQDELNLAIADFDEAIRLDPNHVDALRGRGDCHLYKGEYDLAIADYDDSLRLNPKHARSYLGRGKAYRMKLEFDKAIADYDTVLRLDPDNYLVYRFRGDAYLAKGEYALAIADFNSALQESGYDEMAYRGRGSANLFSGKLATAFADFSSAIENHPYSAIAYQGRGVVREEMGDVKGAAEDYRRARELGYDD